MRMMLLALTFAYAITSTPVSVLAQEVVSGQILKIDESAGKITIKHGPMKKFGLDDGHSMVFRAQDPAMLKSVNAGDKVRFEAERVNGQFTVTKIEKAK